MPHCARWPVFLLLLAGCGSSPAPEVQKAAAPPTPKLPTSALSALYKMYVSGRTWAPDLQPLELQSIPIAEIPAKEGNYGAWQAVFVSESKRARKTYTFSLVEQGERLHEGVFGAAEESFEARSSNLVSFPLAALRVDSPAALKTALEHGGAAFEKKSLNIPPQFHLRRNRRDGSPVWVVYWGATELTARFGVQINADSGGFIQVNK
jgi:hypothetical protein